MTEQVEVRLPISRRHVSLARQIVAAAARVHGLDDVRVEDLRLAVSEAVTNAVRAAPQDTRREIVVRTGPTAEGDFQVVVQGTGRAPVPADVEGEGPVTELGLTLISGLADHVEFSDDHGGQLRMVFAADLQHPSLEGP